jgi:hypothetical protein
MDMLVQGCEGVESSEDVVQTTHIPQRPLHDFSEGGNDEGSGDDLCFDEYMAYQEQGAGIGNQWYTCIAILVKNLNLQEGMEGKNSSQGGYMNLANYKLLQGSKGGQEGEV